MEPSAEKRLVYIIGTFPNLTTSFIDREITYLREHGVDVQVVSVRRPPASRPLSHYQRQLQKGVIYLIPSDLRKLVLSHLYFSLRHPVRFFGSLLWLMTRRHPGMRSRFKSFLHFGEGVYVAYLTKNGDFREFHAHFVDRAATISMIAGWLLKKPYSLSVHAAADIYVQPVILREKILRARHVATCTQRNKEQVVSIVGEDLRDKITHVPHGLDLDAYRPDLVEPGTQAEPLILSVGQLAERKGFVQLLRACRLLLDRGQMFRCRIVGQGPQQQVLEDLIVELELQGNVQLCGALPHEEVVKMYREAALFVLPCIQTKDGDVDGVPNVLAEAMAMGVPVISTAVSAIPELVVDQQSGLLVPPDAPRELADAMQRVLRSPDLQARLARNGRRQVLETFDIERNGRKFVHTMWPEWSDRPGSSHVAA